MITGRFNIVLGFVAMILAAITGFALGLTRDAYFQMGTNRSRTGALLPGSGTPTACRSA